MIKKEIARYVYEKLGTTVRGSHAAVQATLEGLFQTLMENGRVELRGFGIFMIQDRGERKARNPRTGEAVMIPPHKTIVFKPSKLLKSELQTKLAERDRQTVNTAKTAKAAKTSKAAKAAPKAVKKSTKKAGR